MPSSSRSIYNNSTARAITLINRLQQLFRASDVSSLVDPIRNGIWLRRHCTCHRRTVRAGKVSTNTETLHPGWVPLWSRSGRTGSRKVRCIFGNSVCQATHRRATIQGEYLVRWKLFDKLNKFNTLESGTEWTVEWGLRCHVGAKSMHPEEWSPTASNGRRQRGLFVSKCLPTEGMISRNFLISIITNR